MGRHAMVALDVGHHPAAEQNRRHAHGERYGQEEAPPPHRAGAGGGAGAVGAASSGGRGVRQGTTSSSARRRTPAAMRWAISLGCSSSTPFTTRRSHRSPRYAGRRSTTLAPLAAAASAILSCTSAKG